MLLACTPDMIQAYQHMQLLTDDARGHGCSVQPKSWAISRQSRQPGLSGRLHMSFDQLLVHLPAQAQAHDQQNCQCHCQPGLPLLLLPQVLP